MSFGSDKTILMVDLDSRRIEVKFVPKLLSEDQKESDDNFLINC